jgi:hypothetical protein
LFSGSESAEWERWAQILSGATAGKCEICWQEMKRRETLQCKSCGGGVHVSCAFPGLGITRTVMHDDFVCEGCVEFEVLEEVVVGELRQGKAAALAKLAAELEADALASASHSSYSTAVNTFERFLFAELGVDPDRFWDALDRRRKKGSEARRVEQARSEVWRTLQMFVAWGCGGRLKYKTMVTYLAGGISRKMKAAKLGSEEATSHWRVKRALQGWRRRLGDSGEGDGIKSAAVDGVWLEAMVAELLAGRVPDCKGKGGVMSVFEREQAALALIFGFSALARRSEVAGLQVCRVQLMGDLIRVQWSAEAYRRAKSDQESRGQESWIPRWVAGVDVQALFGRHIGRLKAAGVLSDTTSVFRNAAKPKKPWAEGGEAANLMLKRVVEHTTKARPDVSRPAARAVSWHGLRRGGAQHMRDKGVPRDLIKLAGRWRSDAVDEYLASASRAARRSIAAAFRKR